MSLTDRILPILSSKPMASVDVWDALGDSTVSLADARCELRTLCYEDKATMTRGADGTPCYTLAAGVAS